MVKQRSEGNMQCDTWYWCRARSNPPPGWLWRLWRSASILMEPFRPDGNIFCWWMTDMTFTSINDITAALSNTIGFLAFQTTSTASMSLDSTTATTTAVTTLADTWNTATTTKFSTYTISSDISTMTCDPTPVTLSLETLSHISRKFFSNWSVRSLQEAVEIAAWELVTKAKQMSCSGSMICLATFSMLPTPRLLGCPTVHNEMLTGKSCNTSNTTCSLRLSTAVAG